MRMCKSYLDTAIGLFFFFWVSWAITYLSRLGLSSALSSFMNEGCRLKRRRKWRPRILFFWARVLVSWSPRFLVSWQQLVLLMTAVNQRPVLWCFCFSQCLSWPLVSVCIHIGRRPRRFIICKTESVCKWSSNFSGNCSANWQLLWAR